MKLSHIVEYLGDLVHRVRHMLLAAHGDAENSVKSKAGTANFVTEYDVAVQEHLIRRIGAFLPDAVFIAEEKDNDPSVLMAEHCFIIDPIDGTTNFMHDYHQYCISIAMVSRGETVIGMVYNPYSDELFYAIKGEGAYLNKRSIHVSERPSEVALVSFGTCPYYKDTLAEKTFSLATDVFHNVADVRRSGSAALDLAYLATGQTDGFFELVLSPWDFAAGALLVTEAGGKISKADGTPLDLTAPCSVFAGNPETYSLLIELANK